MGFTGKQRAVVRSASLAAVIVAATVAAALLIPSSALPVNEPAARLVWLLPWTLLPLLALMVSVARLANHRFSTAEDIDGAGLTVGTQRVQILRAILQNTLEQTVLALGAYLIAAVVLPHGWLRLLPAAATLFALGRLSFTLGYGRGAAGRGLGFGLTAYPTFALLITLAVILLLRLFAWFVG